MSTSTMMDALKVTVCRPGHLGLGAAWGEAGGWEAQDHDDERDEECFVVIGRDTSDDKCQRLAERYGLTTEALIAFRNDPRAGSFQHFLLAPHPLVTCRAQGLATPL